MTSRRATRAPGPARVDDRARRSDDGVTEGPTGRLWRSAVALTLALVLGLGGWSTWAYWQDRATVTTASFTAGRLDLRVDGENASGANTGYTATAIAASNLLPGESQAYAVVLNNGGNPRVTYSVTVAQGSTWTFVDNPLQLQAYLGTASSTTAAPRTGTCSGASHGNAAVITAGGASVVGSRTLAAGATESLCVVVTMLTTASNGNQGQSGTITLTVTATQVTA